MLYLKACTKCKGDVHLDRDSWGAYLQCLQCGWSRDIPDEWFVAVKGPQLRTNTAENASKAA